MQTTEYQHQEKSRLGGGWNNGKNTWDQRDLRLDPGSGFY